MKAINRDETAYKAGRNFIAADLFISITKLKQLSRKIHATSGPKFLFFFHDLYTFSG